MSGTRGERVGPCNGSVSGSGLCRGRLPGRILTQSTRSSRIALGKAICRPSRGRQEEQSSLYQHLTLPLEPTSIPRRIIPWSKRAHSLTYSSRATTPHGSHPLASREDGDELEAVAKASLPLPSRLSRRKLRTSLQTFSLTWC